MRSCEEDIEYKRNSYDPVRAKEEHQLNLIRNGGGISKCRSDSSGSNGSNSSANKKKSHRTKSSVVIESCEVNNKYNTSTERGSFTNVHKTPSGTKTARKTRNSNQVFNQKKTEQSLKFFGNS